MNHRLTLINTNKTQLRQTVPQSLKICSGEDFIRVNSYYFLSKFSRAAQISCAFAIPCPSINYQLSTLNFGCGFAALCPFVVLHAFFAETRLALTPTLNCAVQSNFWPPEGVAVPITARVSVSCNYKPAERGSFTSASTQTCFEGFLMILV